MAKVLNNKVLLIIVGILLASNIAMLYFFVWMKDSDKKSYRSDRQRSPVGMFLQQRVKFDQKQMDNYDKVRQQHRQRIRPLFEEIRQAKVTFYGLLTNNSSSDSAIIRAADSIGEKQKRIDLQAFQNFREIRKICTPAQQRTYDTMIAGVIENMWFPARDRNMHMGGDSLRRKR